MRIVNQIASLKFFKSAGGCFISDGKDGKNEFISAHAM